MNRRTSQRPPMHSGTLHTHYCVAPGHGSVGRRVRVWTPHGYTEDTARRYPVLYLQDGQNVFDDASAFGGHGWHADGTAQRLIDSKKIEPLILVGIDNAGTHRTADYTPVPWMGRGGHAEQYAELLLTEVLPFVNARYRTKTGPASTAIGGASLGGLFALCAGIRQNDVFGHIAAMSPSVFWANGHVLGALARRPKLPVRIWLDAGSREAANLRASIAELVDLLLTKGWQKHRTASRADLRHLEAKGGRHDEASWGRRFDRVLKFLFPRAPAARKARRQRAPRAPKAATG